MGILTRVRDAFTRYRTQSAVERAGPVYLLLSGGWLSGDAAQWMNWWQMGYDITPSPKNSAIVEACVSAYSQTVAMCPGAHWRIETDDFTGDETGGRVRVDNSALSRVLRKPNDYQTASDFKLNLVRNLYTEGNAYALALRNDRGEITELHPMHPRLSAGAQLAETGDIFYALGGNPIIEKRLLGAGMQDSNMIVPARDVLHVKLHTSRLDHLRGESPLCAVALDLTAGDAIARQQIALFFNQARPSVVLRTDLPLSKEQVTALREAWDRQSRGLNSGGTVVLTEGIKAEPMQITSRDAQVAEILKITERNIALAYRVPLQLLGLAPGPQGATQELIALWIKSGLGFCLEHVEQSFDQLFELRGQPHEYTEFDTSVLLRSNEREQIAGLKEAVMGIHLEP